MTTVAPARPTVADPAPAGGFGGLLRAEAHRFVSRRFIRVLLLLAVLGWIGAVLLALTQFGSVTPERLAEARASVQDVVDEQEQFRQQCLDDPTRPAGVDADLQCGPPLQASDLRVEDFLNPRPFSLGEFGTGGAVAVSAATAVLTFLIGATFVGAEWSTRSMVAMLFWEPRRGRVMLAKAAVVAVACVVLGVVAHVAWLATAGGLQSAVGDGAALPDGFWPELLGTQGRGLLLAVLAGLLGFGLTNLTRNTGAALGIGFVYFAVLETAVRALSPIWQPWLLTNDAAGLLVPGGLRLVLDWNPPDGADYNSWSPPEYVLANLQSGIFLCVVTAVVVAAGVGVFARRDLH
ncbi:ABC-2 family transporter protein [Modestobacter sp. DSM 44400]|uniref:ABC transporter permease subunit n=1 Tax=Modestobacter sp. DSM 44400 TaxID=1550230 RepID=UPI000898C276|nr:ABC transporter permease subunit [Modestobacter sp. DSM 44400]SDX79037.1 ABC-2 family transporter protein [Modestobacter sp. DSM 44400]